VQTLPLILENGIRGCLTKSFKLIYKSNNSNFKHSGLLFLYRPEPSKTECYLSHYISISSSSIQHKILLEMTVVQLVGTVPRFRGTWRSLTLSTNTTPP